MKNNGHIFIIGIVLFLWLVQNNKWNDDYRRPIIGDAKGYYAYLPALFIYQNFSYEFIDGIESNYYPADGSLSKDFLVEQPNGTKVNKCFPGASLFYLPFFLLAFFLSYLFGLPLDGYAPLFQYSIVAAHLCYYLLALFFINRILIQMEVRLVARALTMIVITFGSNAFFYAVYDFSVAHIFGFFGNTVFIYFIYRWDHLSEPKTRGWQLIGLALVILCLLVITRPTNALIVLAIPLFVDLRRLVTFIFENLHWRKLPWGHLFLALLTLSIPLFLWKIQTGSWLVYSYGDEQLNFLQPNLGKFLFSVKKGWWFWSPILLLITILGSLYFSRKNRVLGIYFFAVILMIAYVFSCWWMWTFGMGLGQRPMIDFYPIIAIAFAGFLSQRKNLKWWYITILPLIFLNVVHAHQIHKNILVGGQTTWQDYTQNFLRLKRTAPTVDILDNWKLWKKVGPAGNSEIDKDKPFSETLRFSNPPENAVFVIRAKVGGAHENGSIAVIAADENNYYEAKYIGAVLYSEPRMMEFVFQPNQKTEGRLSFYFWNHNSKEEAEIQHFEILIYLPTK